METYFYIEECQQQSSSFQIPQEEIDETNGTSFALLGLAIPVIIFTGC